MRNSLDRLSVIHLSNSSRVGKFFFVNTSNDKTVIFHFGLTGSFYYFNDEEDQPRFTRVLFRFNNGFRLAFVNMRKFGWVDLIDDLPVYLKKKGLGPDAQQISFDEFFKKLRKRKSFVKPKLLDQKNHGRNWQLDRR